jgi:SOS-response transcriptional repressor LexA
MSDAVLEISNILGGLLNHHRISEAELARQIKVPRATINRLVSGRTPDPRASTLNAIAQYFDITIDELLGRSSISKKFREISHNCTIPILKLEETMQWENLIENPCDHNNSITLDETIQEGKFAIKINSEAMWPQFQDNSIIIINPHKIAINRDFVIVHIKKNNEILFRQLLIEGQYRFLKAINHLFPSIELQPHDVIIGTVIQTRKNYE